MKNIIEKLNKLLEKLPFKGLAEKIPGATREKNPVLNKLIPSANLIVCGLVLFVFVVVIVAGGDSPKSLAKQTHKFSKEAAEVGSNPNKALKLVAKAEALEKKVSKMSEKKQEVYLAELSKLMGGGKLPSLGGSGKSSSSSDKAVPALKGDAVWYLRLAEKFYGADLKFWEKEVTETDAAKAPGYIARGKFNLKITGPITKEQVADIVGAMKNMKGEQASQLVRLDLSGTTGLQMASTDYDDKASFGSTNLGSIVLPDGITALPNAVFAQCPLFEMNPIPASVKRFHGTASLNSTYLSTIVFPVNFRTELSSLTFYSSNIPSTVVFSEGQEVVNLNGYGENSYFGKAVPSITVIFPSTVKKFGCSYGSPTNVVKDGDNLRDGINTFYFYGETPPEVVSGKDMFLKNIKTIYVPQSAIKAYEDAYFSLGNITVKPLPKEKADFSYWLQPVSLDQKAILKEYKAAAEVGKANAKKRDKEMGEAMKKEMQKLGF